MSNYRFDTTRPMGGYGRRQAGGVVGVLHLRAVRVHNVGQVALAIVRKARHIIPIVDGLCLACGSAKRIIGEPGNRAGRGCRTEACFAVGAGVVAILNLGTASAGVILGEGAVEAIVGEIDGLAFWIEFRRKITRVVVGVRPGAKGAVAGVVKILCAEAKAAAIVRECPYVSVRVGRGGKEIIGYYV